VGLKHLSDRKRGFPGYGLLLKSKNRLKLPVVHDVIIVWPNLFSPDFSSSADTPMKDKKPQALIW
jgi:hypothetical protein